MSEILMAAEINCTTGEIIERPLTTEEIEKLKSDALLEQERRNAQEAEIARVDALKASARAKLVSGEKLTEEEAATIVL